MSNKGFVTYEMTVGQGSNKIRVQVTSNEPSVEAINAFNKEVNKIAKGVR